MKTLNYWVMKGNPRHNNWDRMLRPGRTEVWHTYRIPRDMKDGDRVFFWESSPKRRLIGFGSVTEAFLKKDEETGDALYRVRYLTRRLSWMADIDLLRSMPEFGKASFLKSGPASTIFPLTEAQAVALYRFLIARNPKDDIWGELSGSIAIPDIDIAVREGNARLVAHVCRERDRRIVEKKKEDFRSKHGKLFCECCRSDYAFYGPVVDGLFEVHHRSPLAKAMKEVVTSLGDLAVLCSNCHRVIHRFDPMITIEQLSERLRGANMRCDKPGMASRFAIHPSRAPGR